MGSFKTPPQFSGNRGTVLDGFWQGSRDGPGTCGTVPDPLPGRSRTLCQNSGTVLGPFLGQSWNPSWDGSKTLPGAVLGSSRFDIRKSQIGPPRVPGRSRDVPESTLGVDMDSGTSCPPRA